MGTTYGTRRQVSRDHAMGMAFVARLLACLVLGGGLLAACGSTTQSTSSAGCDLPTTEPGEYAGVHEIGDVDQPYWVVVPDAYANGDPAPLYLHLASGTGDHDILLTGWRPYLDDLPGVMVIINTVREEFQESENLIALADEVANQYCIDPNRIHLLGTSHSFTAARQLACEQADRVASAVIALGGTFDLPCNPARPVPLLTFTGDPDRGGVTQLVDTWARLNECDPDPNVEDLGSGVLRKSYQNCQGDIVFYDIEGMGHVWPMNEAIGPGATSVAEYEEVDYLDEAIAFFDSHPLS